MGSLTGRVAVVTGVSRRAGIGFAIAQRLLADGASVVAQSWPAHDAQQPWGADPGGNLITHLRKLEDADYIVTEKTGNGPASRTSVALTNGGRAALDAYTQALRDLLGDLPSRSPTVLPS